jgi:DNA processing protein
VQEPPNLTVLDQSSLPARLRALPDAPESVTIAGDVTPAFTIAIVGTRDASRGAVGWTKKLAGAAVRAGAVVVSGGAYGIDAAAHEGALEAGGRTWLVAPCGSEHVYPTKHEPLYAAVIAGGGAVIWPFPATAKANTGRFHRRNRLLVALADVVVVVQAGVPSGALSAAKQARDLGRPLWAVDGPPWDRRFVGCRGLIDRGATKLTSMRYFFDQVGLPFTVRASAAAPSRARRALARGPRAPLPAASAPSAPHGLDATQLALFEATSAEPRHLDEIADRARVCTSAAATGLLTLALENVVVEGPGGFYRRGFDT